MPFTSQDEKDRKQYLHQDSERFYKNSVVSERESCTQLYSYRSVALAAQPPTKWVQPVTGTGSKDDDV